MSTFLGGDLGDKVTADPDDGDAGHATGTYMMLRAYSVS
jgi:hypothetical protein